MKLSIFVLVCSLASAISAPVAPNQSKSSLITTITTQAQIESTDAPSNLSSKTATVVKDDSITDNVKITATATKPKSTKISTTIIDNTKKFPEGQRGRGSKKFNMAKKPEEKPVREPVEIPAEKPEEIPKEEIPEPEQKSIEEPKDGEVDEEKTEANEEKQPEQKPKETVDDDESISTVSGKTVPADVHPRILSAEERHRGRKYKDIRIVQLESEMEENGKYHYSYENEDGTVVQQSGEMRMMDTSDGEKMMGESVVGAYSYKDDDGNTISVSYTADENGFRPVGSHIPTMPPAIARSLAWQATAKPWIDPWVVQQEKLRKARKLKSKSDEEKTTNIA